MDNKYVFISYSHNDFKKVYSIITAMKNCGVPLWYDEGIEAGTEWPEYIAQQIREASVFIAFVSPSAVASMNCRNEINYALSLGKEMLIVYLEPTDLSAGMQLQLGSLQAMFYSRSKSEAEFVENLLRSKILQGVLPEKAPRAESKTPVASTPTQSEKRVPPSPTADEPDDTASVRDLKRKLAANIIIPVCSILAVIIGILEMHFVTKYVTNGFLIFLLGVIAPLAVFLPLHTVYSLKMHKYSSDVCDKINDNCCVFEVLAFFVQVVADVFYIHSTDKVFLKILISIGINLLAYFAALACVPSGDKAL